MAKIKVKFNCSGKWADSPADPIFEVNEGDIVEVSASLANIIVDAEKGEIVVKEKKKEETKKSIFKKKKDK